MESKRIPTDDQKQNEHPEELNRSGDEELEEWNLIIHLESFLILFHQDKIE